MNLNKKKILFIGLLIAFNIPVFAADPSINGYSSSTGSSSSSSEGSTSSSSSDSSSTDEETNTPKDLKDLALAVVVNTLEEDLIKTARDNLERPRHEQLEALQTTYAESLGILPLAIRTAIEQELQEKYRGRHAVTTTEPSQTLSQGDILTVSPESTTLVIASSNEGTLHLWERDDHGVWHEKNDLQHVQNLTDSELLTITYGNDSTLAICYADTIFILEKNEDNWNIVQRIPNELNKALVALSPQGNILAKAHPDGIEILQKIDNEWQTTQVLDYSSEGNRLYDLQFDTSNTNLLSLSEDHVITAWTHNVDDNSWTKNRIDQLQEADFVYFSPTQQTSDAAFHITTQKPARRRQPHASLFRYIQQSDGSWLKTPMPDIILQNNFDSYAASADLQATRQTLGRPSRTIVKIFYRTPNGDLQHFQSLKMNGVHVLYDMIFAGKPIDQLCIVTINNVEVWPVMRVDLDLTLYSIIESVKQEADEAQPSTSGV